MHADTERSAPNAAHELLVDPQPPISVSYFIHVIRGYRPFILLVLGAVALAYLILALAFLLWSPSEQITSQPFRLDFEGAGDGLYPNKTKFNIADIITVPIVTRVWQENQLGDYIPLGDFTRSVFVLESNRQYELLAAEYQARLADPKLSSVDRERLQRDFELKTQSITKNEYSLNLNRRGGTRMLPRPMARKVLLEILNGWADFAVNQQHVLSYQVSVLSPEILKPSAVEQRDPIAAIEVLRSKSGRVLANIDKLAELPGATLARTPQGGMSLEEVRIRIDDVMRFRLEPLLVSALHSPALGGNMADTQRFLESQLAYDQRQLESARRFADAFRESITLYEQPASEAAMPSAAAKSAEPGKGSEALMPQLSDTFLDRLVTMTGRAADAQYRQRAVDDYRRAVGRTVPLQHAVAFDTAILEELRRQRGGSANIDPATVRASIEETRTEIAGLINKMNELYQIVSRNMTPSTELFTLTGPATFRTVRSVSLQRLAMYGLLLLLITLPAVLVVCLIHNRLREEESAEDFVRRQRQVTASS